MTLSYLGVVIVSTLIAVARCADRCGNQTTIESFVDGFYARLGKPGLAGKNYSACFTPDGKMNIGGKTV